MSNPIKEPTPTPLIVRSSDGLKAPTTPDELWDCIAGRFGYSIQRKALIPGHAAPFDYVVHSFFEHDPIDCIVWGARGAGKTFLGALVTALELLFKPGIQVRILAGSLEQASRMYAHLRCMCAIAEMKAEIEHGPTARRILMKSGGGCEVLAQSQPSVRGTRVQRLRCDEVDLFTPAIWEAAQLTTRSTTLNDGKPCRASVECLSTMHEPFGLMSRLVRDAAAGTRKLFKWGIVDVLEHCPESRQCATCVLQPECGGKAKRENWPALPGRGRAAPPAVDAGHVSIADVIRMKSRVSTACWEAEMLCVRVRRSNCVYPEFDPLKHVVDNWGWNDVDGRPRWFCGMDFGFRTASVVVWGALDGMGRLWIVDEHSAEGKTVAEHAQAMRERPWPPPEWIGADPAGRQASAQTAISNVEVLERAGFNVRTMGSEIPLGLGLVRSRLAPASGPPRLFVHGRCTRLIQALTEYHFDPKKEESDRPVKDGSDHACDALRYLVLNLDGGGEVKRGSYL